MYDKAVFQKITWLDRLLIAPFPTYIQIAGGMVCHYKCVNGRIYIIKIEPLVPLQKAGGR